MTQTKEPAVPARLLKIQEVAAELGLTPRRIRYYEELGLLRPAARSEGDYRLYDADDLERLSFIKGLRDDAGFGLAEIGQLLEDEVARARNRERYRATESAPERRAILDDAVDRIDRQVTSLRDKIGRLEAMIQEADARRAHLLAHRAEIDGQPVDPHDPDAVAGFRTTPSDR
ncbi:MAG TPA: MerR family transcriptional regulator [Candidatus Limnocylindrales bacterium]|nr:MerR family transcriptional regulator [Candidatus Limnocylindrales bacterium]